MALNKRHDDGPLSLTATHPTTPTSGAPCRVGKMAGVALTDERSDGKTTIEFEGVFDLNVDDDAGTGIAIGDELYYQDTATGSPATSVNNNSTTPEAFFGYALGTLGTNATGTIPVKLARSH